MVLPIGVVDALKQKPIRAVRCNGCMLPLHGSRGVQFPHCPLKQRGCMCKSLTKVEELPSGKRVMYIDVGGIHPSNVQEYMKKVVSTLNEPDTYVLPVRPNKCSCHEHNVEQKGLMLLIGLQLCILIISIFR